MNDEDIPSMRIPEAEYDALRHEVATLRRRLIELGAPSAAIHPSRFAGIDTLRRSIAAIVEGKADDVPVATEARTFRVVARVLDDLSRVARRCAGPDCYGWSEEGQRLLVPIARLDEAEARAEQAAREAEALRAELALARSDSFRF